MRRREPVAEGRKRRLRVLGFAGVVTLAGLAALDALFPPDLGRYLARSVMVADREGRPLRAFTAEDGAWRFAVRPGEVSPLYLRFLLAREDRSFRSHPGVDPLAMVRAIAQFLAAGRVVSGASTLTMQTVRLLEPRPRTLAAKLVEMVRAFQLERRYSKDEILAMYLTLAPFGGNLEGVRAAALFYFGHDPLNLTPAEAALLVALPQSPSRLRPDRFPERAMEGRAKVLRRLVEAGLLGETEAAGAGLEAIPPVRLAAPFLAPHLAARLARREPGREVHATTIDRSLQEAVEDLARRHLARLEPEATAALMVVENATRAVRAYVGSADFLDGRRLGQVDMVAAVRSPGSALKPFVYGLAFDLINLHPETVVSDRPMRFGDYAPSNFDGTYHGDLTVREALHMSLNVPAVAVLDRIGPARFARLLTDAGADLHLDSRIDRPALPMILGGVGMTLADLTRLYVGLANRGVVAPLRLSEGDAADEGRRLMSGPAAWSVTTILRGTPPPADRPLARHTRNNHPIALKTGTSYGFRDAWSVGFDTAHTVGVWVGRADGGFGSSRTGHLEAAPLVYDVFDLLPGGRADPAEPSQAVLAAHTGDLPPPLRRFIPSAEVKGGRAALEISFPPDGAVLEVAGAQSLQLQASGGSRPLVWLIDGVPLPASPVRRDAVWTPEGGGAARITVIDAEGRSASAEVWLQKRR